MRRLMLARLVLLVNVSAAHVWQRGTWRALDVTQTGGAMSIPMTIVPGTAPIYLSVPLSDEIHYVTIDGPSGLRYVARSRRRFTDIIINDSVEFVVEGQSLYVKGAKPKQVFKLQLVSTTRLVE